MPKTYTNLLEKRLTNQVLAISYDKLDLITSQVTLRLLAGQALDQTVVSTQHSSISSTEIPIVEVFDSLVAKNGAGISGFTSYESIASDLTSYVESGHKKILMYIDSPGGEVAGLFALTDYMQSLKAQGVELVGITDGLCASAAYAIGSACSSLYATAGCEIGSIGVIIALIDTTEMDKEDGLKYTILRSKDEKALGNPHEATTEKVISNFEAKLSEYDTLFNNMVAKCKPKLTIDAIISMKGNTFLSNKALELNLIDGIVVSVQDYINSLASNKSSQQPNTRGISMSETMTLEAALAQVGSLSTELMSVKASLATAEAKGKSEEQQRILGILKAATTFNQPVSSTEKLISKGYSAEQAVDMFELAVESKQAANAVNTSGSNASLGLNSGIAKLHSEKPQGSLNFDTRDF